MHYAKSDRRPLVVVVTLVTWAFVAYGLLSHAPPIVLAPAVVGGLLATVALLLNRQHGLEIDGDVMRVWSGRKVIGAPLDKIREVTIRDWSDSVDWALTMKDDTRIELPSQAIPPRPALTEMLRRAMIPMRQE